MTPLSSDAFTRFGTDHAEEHNKEVEEIFQKLLKVIIPNVASELLLLKEPLNNVKLVEILHKNGINLRYLGNYIKYT